VPSLPPKPKEALAEAVGFEGCELTVVSGAPVSTSQVRVAGGLSVPAALREITRNV
jgi:hypothetical protein